MMVEPLCLAMTSTHVIAASNDTIFVWMYNAAAGLYLHSVSSTTYTAQQTVTLSVLTVVCQAVLISYCE